MGPPTSIISQENASQGLPTGQSGGGVFLNRGSFLLYELQIQGDTSPVENNEVGDWGRHMISIPGPHGHTDRHVYHGLCRMLHPTTETLACFLVTTVGSLTGNPLVSGQYHLWEQSTPLVYKLVHLFKPNILCNHHGPFSLNSCPWLCYSESSHSVIASCSRALFSMVSEWNSIR